MRSGLFVVLFFFFNDTATTEIYTLSLHDALPISSVKRKLDGYRSLESDVGDLDTLEEMAAEDESMAAELEIGRSTRLNSSHANISYAVFCLKKKLASGRAASRSAPAVPNRQRLNS